jgi:hypothetical protein
VIIAHGTDDGNTARALASKSRRSCSPAAPPWAAFDELGLT